MNRRRLVAEMLEGAGIDGHGVIAERDPDTISPGDVGAAITGHRAVYEHVIAHTAS